MVTTKYNISPKTCIYKQEHLYINRNMDEQKQAHNGKFERKEYEFSIPHKRASSANGGMLFRG
jgi:hypothetical protein